MTTEDVIKIYPVGIVYKIVNTENSMVYIGSTVQTAAQRMGGHREDSKTYTSKFHVATREIGIDKFTIQVLEKMKDVSPKELVVREFEVIGEYKAEELYNTELVHGMICEETRTKLSLAQIGKIISEETKAKMSIASTGRTHSDETKAKMSLAHTGKTLSDETKIKISHANCKRGGISTREKKNLFEFRYYVDGTRKSKSFCFSPRSKWSREEALEECTKFRDSIYPL